MRRLTFAVVVLFCAFAVGGPLPEPTPAHAAPGDETFVTVAGATAHVWSGGSMALGTTGGSLPPSISAVFQWSNANQSFKFWFRGFPVNFNTLASLEKNGFYFFQGTGGVTVTIDDSANYLLPAVGQFTTVPGATGELWTGGSPTSLDSLPAAISAVFEWANETQSFRFWFRGFPANFNTLATVQAGGFYFFQGNAAVSVSVKLVDRVEIDQTGLLFTQAGQTRQLSAKAFDTQGALLTIPISWASTSPSVSVDANGLAASQTSDGTSQLTAQAGGIKSAPLLVLITQPPPGAILLTDSQVVGEPIETTPNAPPSFDNTYQVVLTGIAAPAIGAILINTGSKAVAGRVVGIQSAGNQHTVTLQLLSMREMFPTLELNDTMDLSRAPLTIPPTLAADYDITRSGNTISFVPKSGGGPFRAGTGALTCETSLPSLPITLSAPPIFSVSLDLSLDLVYTLADGLERFVIKGSPTYKIEGGIIVSAAFEVKVECKAELLTLRIPIGGPLSLVVSGLVPLGVGFEIGGKVTVLTMGLKTVVEASGPVEVGVSCLPGLPCEFAKVLGPFDTKITPTVDMPSLGDVRVEPSMMGFGFLKAAIGNPFFRSLRIDAFNAKVGVKLQSSFAPLATQITDTAYKSDYKVTLEATAGVGTDLDGIAKLFGISSITAVGFMVSTDLAKSPSGTITADKATFAAGETVRFKTTFDQVELFPIVGPYNVKKVLIVRNDGPPPAIAVATVVATFVASTGQTVFDFEYDATLPGSAGDFYAFVVTSWLPADILALEVGAAQPPASGISAGLAHTCVLTPLGGVKCWGLNDRGQLGNDLGGDPTVNKSNVPVDVVGLASGVKAISAGVEHTCALTEAGGVKCWGSNNGGQLGNGTNANSIAPVDVFGLTSGVQAISAGYNYTCALTVAGGVKCWGYNGSGQLGNNSTASSSVPADVFGLESDVQAISAGYYQACAVTVIGAVKCWGVGVVGEPTPGDLQFIESHVPVGVLGLAVGVQSVSVGNLYACALTTVGTVKCWGRNNHGQLGINDPMGSAVPVDATAGVQAVSAGGQHTCAVAVGGAVKCWGSNQYGRLGNGSFTDSPVPVDVVGLTGGGAVSAGGEHTCSIGAGGAAKCWGLGFWGALGNGSLADSNVPVNVSGFP